MFTDTAFGNILMARGQVAMLDPLRRLIGRQAGCSLSDTQLLEQYVSGGDAASFEVLVWRHGAMVLGLCRRVLRDEHEAEDAFQATFLVFARKAASVGRGEAVGCWLYKVAYRVALRLRAAAAKRPSGEPTDELAAPEQPDDAAWRDLRPVLDEEISRLPEKYRAPFVLCYLQGRTNEEAAVELGCPKGTVLSRLARGREWLRERLTRRGLAPAAVALALNLSPQSASAAVPALLAQSTVGVAIPFAAGTAAELLPAHIAALAEGVIRTMIATKLKVAAATLVALFVVSGGVGWAAFGQSREDRGRPANPTNPANPAVPTADRAAPQERGGDRVPDPTQPPRDVKPAFSGKVVDVAKDGKSFAVEIPPRESGETVKHMVKTDDKTHITYNGVGPNGAKPTDGYTATVWLADGSKDTASFVTFTGSESGRRGADVTGTLVVARRDAKSITVELRGGRDERGAEPKQETVSFDEKTVITFSNVGPGDAKPTAGLVTHVWYADDVRVAGNRIAAVVQFVGTATEGGRRDEKRPGILGKVVGVADEGKKITLEVPAAVRGEEPTKVVVRVTDKSVVVFHNVGLDGAKPAEGQQAQVWLADNSKDTAAKIVLIATPPERWTTVASKVVAVGKDGSSVTIEQPATARGEEPTRTEIKLTKTTTIAYFGVGPDEAKLAEGLHASVRLLDGSKDTASQVIFSKAGEGRR